MKFLFVFLLLLISFVGAEPLSVQFEKESYAAGETLQARITYLSELQNKITAKDIHLFDYNSEEIDAAFFFVDLNENESFLFFNIPSVGNGSYYLTFKDIIYMSEGFLVSEDYSSNFSVIEKNTSVSIFPGVYIVKGYFSDTSFSFRVTANKGDVKAEVTSSDFINVKPVSFFLKEGWFEDVNAYVDLSRAGNDGFIKISYGQDSYTIPVFVPGASPVESVDISEEDVDVRFLEIKEINKVLSYGQEVSGLLEIGNFGTSNLTGLEFSLDASLSGVVRMNLTKVDSFNSGEVIDQYLWINENAKAGNYSGNLNFGNSLFTLKLPIFVSVINVEEDEEEIIIEGENKSEDIDTSRGNFTGFEEETKESKWWLWIIFIFFFIVILGLGYMFYLKKSRPEDFEDFLDGLRGR